MMLGLLLARAGVQVVVLEKHADFLRDFLDFLAVNAKRYPAFGLRMLLQDRVINRVLGSTRPIEVAWPVRLLNSWPFLRRIPARILGLGFRPEHVRTADIRGALSAAQR